MRGRTPIPATTNTDCVPTGISHVVTPNDLGSDPIPFSDGDTVNLEAVQPDTLPALVPVAARPALLEAARQQARVRQQRAYALVSARREQKQGVAARLVQLA